MNPEPGRGTTGDEDGEAPSWSGGAEPPPPVAAGAEPPRVEAAPPHATEDPTDGSLRPLAPAYRLAERASGRILAGIGLVVGLVGWAVAVPSGWLQPPASWIVLAAGPVLLALIHRAGLAYTALELRHTRYRLGADALELRKGVWWRRVVHVPCSRVQHIDVAQGPLQRRYGIATLTVHTAGTEDASVELGGLEHALALRLRDELLRRSGQHGDPRPREAGGGS